MHNFFLHQQNVALSSTCNKRADLLKGGILCLLLALFSYSSIAQTGYIYLHKRALDENSSPNFTFSITGGPTTVAPITLNDQAAPFLTPIIALGGDAGGGLWAMGGSNLGGGSYGFYYRAANSSTWIITPGSGTDIDGGATGTRITIGSGNIFYYNGTTDVNVTYGLTNVTGVSDNWVGTQYAILANGQFYKKTIAATSWTQIPGIGGNNLDAVPNTSRIVYVQSDNTVASANNDGSGASSMGNPDGNNATQITDIAVSGNGTVFARDGMNVYRYTGIGTNWELEKEGYLLHSLTAGPVSQLWGSQTQAKDRLYTRTETKNYIADENIRTSSLNDNSTLIAVSAGTYIITETGVTGWDLNAIDIYETQSIASSKNIPAKTASIVVSAGEVVHVVFENQLVQSTLITNTCASSSTFFENFGTGTDYGLALTGLTSYHQANSTFGFGYYALISNTDLMQPASNFGSRPDHTPGDVNGRMLVVDATSEKGTFYRRRFIGLIPGSTYTFSAWAMNINSDPNAIDKPNVNFEVYDPATGTLINSGSSGDLVTAGLWKHTTFVFTATKPELDLLLRNNTTGSAGNDLAIDDISFGVAIPQPVTVQTNANCTQGGTITVTSPLSSGYEYSVDGITYQTSPVFTNLAAGSYSVTARYVSGTCTSPMTPVAITQTCPPTANDDNSSGNTTGSNVTINILTNDLTGSGNPATPGNTTVTFNTTGLPAGSTIVGNTITVPGEGVYTYDPATGNLTFDPAPTFTGNPTPLNYTLTEIATGLSDPAVVTITYGTLPVKLISFTATKNEAVVNLNWSTTEELNSERFDIQRSENGKEWALIGTVNSEGESKSIIKYNFLDNQPLEGDNYYRLKMIDKDQTFAYSRIQNVNFESGSEAIVIYPNPVSNELFFKNMKESVKEIVIININGQVVFQMGASNKVVNDVKLSNNGLDVSKLKNGIYLVKITKVNGALDTHKIVISR